MKIGTANLRFTIRGGGGGFHLFGGQKYPFKVLSKKLNSIIRYIQGFYEHQKNDHIACGFYVKFTSISKTFLNEHFPQVIMVDLLK